MQCKNEGGFRKRDLSIMIRIQQVEATQAEVADLIDKLDQYQESMYPSESNHLDSIEALSKMNVNFVGAYADQEICGIGAVKIIDDYGEIKRLYIPEKHRGKGIAEEIIKELENYLIKQSVFTARLETGIHQLEAIGLYKKLGYCETEPFGEYSEDPLSVFMGKELLGNEKQIST
jgi:putative acetyltransferase